jgi:hypothetical protein
MYLFNKRAILILWLTVLFSGCVGVQYDFPSKVPEKLEGYRSQIAPGQTKRKEVHERIGKPLLGNDRIEVYRALSGHDVMVGAYLGILPVWWEGTEEVIIYAMIAYDKDNVVQAIDWDIYRHDPDDVLTDYASGWGSPARQAKFRSASLSVHGFRFVSIQEGFGFSSNKKDFLLAPPAETRAYLNASPPSGKCAITVFFFKPYHPKHFYIDGELIGEAPLMSVAASSGLEKVFAKVLVDNGLHELVIKTNYRPHRFQQTIRCESQKRFFLYPQFNMVKSERGGLWRLPWKYEGQITVRDAPQEPLDGWQRLLFYKGKWIGGDLEDLSTK